MYEYKDCVNSHAPGGTLTYAVIDIPQLHVFGNV